MELDYHQRLALLQRFPSFELSYETVLHNKVEPHYNLAVAIALGKKCFAWFSFDNAQNVCYIMELNKDKKISKIVKYAHTTYPASLCVGTILYGTLAEMPPPASASPSAIGGSAAPEHAPLFVVEDIYQAQLKHIKDL